MIFGISSEFTRYLEAVACGDQVIYHGGMDMLTLFKKPTDPLLSDEPYPYVVAILYDPYEENRTPKNAIGFKFHSMSVFLSKPEGQLLHPYLVTNKLETSLFVSAYESEILGWKGWQLAHNKDFYDRTLRHKPGATKVEMQKELDAYKIRNEEIFKGVWDALKSGAIPATLPTRPFTEALELGRSRKRKADSTS